MLKARIACLSSLLILLLTMTPVAGQADNPFNPPQLAKIATALGTALQGKGDPANTPLAIVVNWLSPFWTAGQIGSQRAASELGVPVLFTAPIRPGDKVSQRRIVDELVAEGCKGLAISVIDSDFIEPELKSVTDKNINFIAIDSDMPKTDRRLYLGTDNYEAGVLAGKALLAALGPNGGKVVGLVGELTAANSVERIQGIKDTLAGTNVVLETVLVDGLDPLKSTNNASTALEQEPDLAAFVTLYSYDAEGAAEALELANKLGTVKIVAFDLEPATIKLLKQGYVSAAIVQRPYYMGYLSPYILDAMETLGPDKTMSLLSPFLSGPNKDSIDTGADMVSPDTLPLYLQYLNSIGIASE